MLQKIKTLNLDKDFHPFGKENQIEFERFQFPSGCEPHIRLKLSEEELISFNLQNEIDRKVIITCRIHSTADIFELLLVTDSLRRVGIKRLELFIPYLPFARQDRVMVKGEPLSLKVFSDLINSQNYEKLFIYDPHSDVSMAVLNNSEKISNHLFVEKVLNKVARNGYQLVSPDAGACKKIYDLAKSLNSHCQVITCNKVRDVQTGNILSIECFEQDFRGMPLYIVDDICDGGGTFVLLAKELKKRNAGKINLVVSHGIFSKGLDVFENIDHIYSTDSFKTIENSDKFTQIKLQEIF